MIFSPLDDITFDKDDANLFQVDDARLEADALKHSVLPRLRVVANVAVALIQEIYGIDVLEDSAFWVYPNFREKRYKNEELLFRYHAAFVGIGGQGKAKWPAFSRWDGKRVTYLPFRYGFRLSQWGLANAFDNGLFRLKRESYDSILQFHLDNEAIVNRLCFASQISPDFYMADNLPLYATFAEHYRHRIEHGEYDNHFVGNLYKFPVERSDLLNIVHDFVRFFPVYDAYIQMAKGEPSRLTELVDRLSKCETEEHPEIYGDEGEAGDDSATDDVVARAKEAAASRVPVMPAMRWRVFQRDGWKCVACGRTSHDGAILHVDHIVPRSKGGPDTLENFQTLCETCNIGKSNRDATDLRRRS